MVKGFGAKHFVLHSQIRPIETVATIRYDDFRFKMISSRI
jgi:hypothetical protein